MRQKHQILEHPSEEKKKEKKKKRKRKKTKKMKKTRKMKKNTKRGLKGRYPAVGARIAQEHCVVSSQSHCRNATLVAGSGSMWQLRFEEGSLSGTPS